MKHNTLKAGGKKGRNRYLGKWIEPVSEKIDLPFTAESMKMVLALGATPEISPFTHQDIAHWCDRFHMTLMDADTDSVLITATRIAADVEVQWNLYLANSYSLEQLQAKNFAEERVPVEWFGDWLRQLEAGQKTVQPDDPTSAGCVV